MIDQVVKSHFITILYSMMIFTIISGFLFGQKTSSKGDSPSEIIVEILKANENAISGSRQIIIVTADSYNVIPAETTVLKKTDRGWIVVFGNIKSTLGKKGFAAPGEKKEGDWKTPSGIYNIGLAFGYAPQMETVMPYRQATENDFWVDDPESPQYNTWVTGTPNAKSFEKMKRKDHLYKMGFVVEYNTNPVVKGNGSAIFFHVWRKPGAFTAGCVAMAEEDIEKIIRFLDPKANPIVIMEAKDDISI